MMRFLTVVFSLLASGVFAQSSVPTTDGAGAVLRSLDRITGQVLDFEVKNGDQFQRGKMNVVLRECRYPKSAIDRDAFAYMTIRDNDKEQDLFAGWMVASSPALSSLEHSRFDVWVLRCLAPS
tara:strand:- start:9157 stop:9525 length:369 start_codon:yes stop_codon:yes gene_type:complete